MAYQVASSCDFCGLPWSGYVCCEGLQPSQPKDNDIETDVSQYYLPYCENFASSSSFPDLSLSGSAELTSASSSASEVDFTDFMKQKTGDFRSMDPSTSRSGLMAAETTTHSDVNGYVDPRLVVSGLPSCNNPNTSDHMGNATLGGSLVQRFYNDFRPPLVDQVSSSQYPTNDFDIALSEVQSTIHAFKPSLNLWLRTWVAMNPQKFPNNQELESLRTLSGLSEAEIITCLSEHVLTQVTSAAEAMDTEPTIRDAEQTSYQKRPPRYRPKCRRSRRRFRYVAETQDETRIFECTHRCGQSFARKGQWTRHERSNVEEWKCHRCDFVSARKDKLRSHLTEVHSLRGGPRKSHCRQLLQPSARSCGFCLDRFENWSAWLNHISAHFEGHIAGGPWTMARWNRAVDPDFGSSESDDDDDDDNDDDDDQAGNEEDQDDPDYGNSATDQTGNSSSKGKDASYGSGSKGSSRSSSKSKSSGSRSSKSHRGASRALSYLQQDYYTSQSDRGCKLARSHTMSPLKPRADLVPLGGEGNRGFLRYRKPDRPVVQSSQTCSPKDSSGVEMESVSSILPPHERERRQDQPLRLSAVNSNTGYGDAMSGVSPLPKALVMQQNNVTPPGMTLPHAASHRNNPIVAVADAGKSTLITMLCEKTKDPDRHGRNSCKYQIFHPLTTDSCNAYRQLDNFGMSLWWAATNGHEAVAKLLLDKEDVDPDSKGDYGGGPDLHRYEHKESQKTLGTLRIDQGLHGDHERSRKIDRTTSVEMAHDLRRRIDDRVEFFLPAKGIDFDGVIASDIKCYLGPEASVSVGVRHKDGIAGYLIEAHGAAMTAMTTYLKADPRRWREEQQTTQSSSSTTDWIRLQYGPTYRAPNAISRQSAAPIPTTANSSERQDEPYRSQGSISSQLPSSQPRRGDPPPRSSQLKTAAPITFNAPWLGFAGVTHSFYRKMTEVRHAEVQLASLRSQLSSSRDILQTLIEESSREDAPTWLPTGLLQRCYSTLSELEVSLRRASLSKQAILFETSRQKHRWSSFGAEISAHNAKLLLHSSILALDLASHRALEDSASGLEAVYSKAVRLVDVDRRVTMSSTTENPRISGIPRTVDEAYNKILERSSDPGKAMRLLHIVIAARPLSLKEISQALLTEESHKSYDDIEQEQEPEARFRATVRDLCGLFVTIDSKIYLLHQTAKEFLVQNESLMSCKDPSRRDSLTRQLKWEHSLQLADSNRILAKICIWYLNLLVLESRLSAITGQSLRGRWRQLILRLLLRLDGNSSSSSFVPIVDALDECEGENKDSVELSADVGSTDLIQDNKPLSDEEALRV
jgi:hypothetical protein